MRIRLFRLPFLLAPFVLLLLPGVAAQAQWAAGRSYRFVATSHNNPANVAAGERQLWVRVFPQSNTTDFVEMHFWASGGEPPYEPLAITQVVIDDRIDLFDDVVVVRFSDLEPVDFDVIWDPTKPWLFTIRSNPADPVYWGVGPDDDFPLVLLIHYYPDLTLNGISGMDLVVAAQEDAHHVGDIPVELTVAGFADNGVETFRLVKEELGSGPIPGPEPATGGPAAALAALAVLCRRRSRARAARSRSLRS